MKKLLFGTVLVVALSFTVSSQVNSFETASGIYPCANYSCIDYK